MENYKNIVNYEGYYQIDCFGNVKSVKSNKILKLRKYSDGYFGYALYKNGIRKEHKQHRLIAENFISLETDKKIVNHKNGNTSDNRIENLEWVNQRENISHYHSAKKLLGVSKQKSTNKYTSRIFINGKNINIGLFKCETAAHLAYVKYSNKNKLTNKYI
jgi:hypothetical protein